MLEICSACDLVNIDDAIIRTTIDLRRKNKIKLPDAIIYATALTQGMPLLTNNIADFKNLGNKVELIAPFHL